MIVEYIIMEEIKELLEKLLNQDFIEAVLSNPRRPEEAVKVKVRPVYLKGERRFQVERFVNKQAYHRNLPPEAAVSALTDLMENMKQLQAVTATASYTVLVSKKGRVTISRRAERNEAPRAAHDRAKQYLLPEGEPVPFLVDLGVMTPEGRVVKAHFHKFRQINRFLEFIEDVRGQLDQSRELTVIDFGCGKSYLTFAMYYYLVVKHGYRIRMTGLDLKTEVIDHCNGLARKYGYRSLQFAAGDIKDYQAPDRVDMVVTLHACDTATDYALAKAAAWGAQVILSVPCCQHELNGQIHNEVLAPVLKYGLIKERLSALVTDALRAEYLEGKGYRCQLLEFIELEHTPKNILIRAVRTGQRVDNAEAIADLEAFLGVDPSIGRLLKE